VSSGRTDIRPIIPVIPNTVAGRARKFRAANGNNSPESWCLSLWPWTLRSRMRSHAGDADQDRKRDNRAAAAESAERNTDQQRQKQGANIYARQPGGIDQHCGDKAAAGASLLPV
jgi:hypothetical protein